MMEDQSKIDGKLSLSEMSERGVTERTELKLRLRDFLRRRPGNLSAAGREFGLPRSKVEEIVRENQGEFEDVENEYLDNLEEKIFLSALGNPPDEDFSFNEAMKILERKRPERWAGKPKAKDKKPAALGKDAEAILKQHFAQRD